MMDEHKTTTTTPESESEAVASRSPRRRILLVSCDLPSHPYAAAKLSKVYASAGHVVTLASPEGPAHDRCREETLGTPNVRCVTVGSVSTKKHMNVRPVTDPHSWKTLYEAVKKPFYLATAVNDMFDEQDGMFLPLIAEMKKNGGYELVIGMHSVAATVADAVESVRNETGTRIPMAIFSSLPYDPAIYLGERKAWYYPRTLSTFPHVATYSATPPKNPVRYMIQIFWQFLDAWLTVRAWAKSAAYNNERRARRGLGPIPNGFQGYLQRYPAICFGGVFPYLDSDSPISANATVIGSLEHSPKPIEGDLKRWLEENDREGHGIVYASFGTGTVLSDQEATAIAGDMVRSLVNNNSTIHQYSTLIALRSSEQKRLRAVFDAGVGSAPTAESETYLEYLGGRLRIESDVPQSSLLSSGRVRVFLSHMGMGGFVEGAVNGAPFIAFPSGCDQWFNAQRAVDAGIAIQAPYGLANIGDLIWQSLHDDDMLARAKDCAKKLSIVNGEERALQLVDRLTTTTTKQDACTLIKNDQRNKVTSKSQGSSSTVIVARQRFPITIPAKAA